MQHFGGVRSALMASGGMPSGPAAFPFFRCLIALLISASFGLFSLTCKGALAGCMSGISLGGSLLSCRSIDIELQLPEVFFPPLSLLFLASEQVSALGSDRSVRDLSITFQFPCDGI